MKIQQGRKKAHRTCGGIRCTEELEADEAGTSWSSEGVVASILESAEAKAVWASEAKNPSSCSTMSIFESSLSFARFGGISSVDGSDRAAAAVTGSAGSRDRFALREVSMGSFASSIACGVLSESYPVSTRLIAAKKVRRPAADACDRARR